ncbi:hypothetical protein IB238_00695 [Rhizobium sp. ARZ01]|uniref:hypothetical protein n=1 Tax=Rhizobium sp. ARZ01 TaxID=2769313 RepID=UPI00177C9E4D|nr:hypothetical protein [Rhizobium sp. ARZ01]MBD9371156.1 hypothetical protein [Rhizobium sp. ARZ01]
MKQTIAPDATPDTWSPEALLVKAQRYVENMLATDSDKWEYALWSSLSLEFLARAALANVSPALLADNKDSWASLFHALGFKPTEARFTPKSISISEVFRRLAAIIPDFSKENADFGILHTGRRNSELHSGEAAFEGVNPSRWQPEFYQASEILLRSMGMSLPDLIGEEEAEVAAKLIDAAADVSAKAVFGDIEAHNKSWNARPEEERLAQAQAAAIWATRQYGHRVVCPACASQALVVGEPVTAPVQKLDDGEITETQEHLPNRFECIACGLKIAGLSRLAAAGLGERYKKTQVYDAAEYYAPQDDYSGYEEDNNER